MSKFMSLKRTGFSLAPLRCAPLVPVLLLAALIPPVWGQDEPSAWNQDNPSVRSPENPPIWSQYDLSLWSQYDSPLRGQPDAVKLVNYQQESTTGASIGAFLKILDPAPPSAPTEDSRTKIPISGTKASPNVKVESRNGLLTLLVRDAPLYQVLSLIAQTQGLNVVSAENIQTKVSVTLHDVPLKEALTAILSIAGYTWSLHNDVINIASIAAAKNLPPAAQGRIVKVFPLDYAAADAVAAAVQGFLSPGGKVFFHQSASNNNLKTKEFVVVQDMPQFLGPISDYIAQIDQPPRQVMIEAYILEVALNDDNRHGVNFKHFFDVAGNAVTLETTGFANPAATPAFLATIKDGNLEALVEALQTTTDVKTLASPKLLVLNGQRAHLQVGEQLGFRVTTTTETSSLESVDFLNVGVVLTLTPRISRDNRIMLHVKPEVSSGEVNPDTGLPEEKTNQVETDVLLSDGQGMVIGGLIQEKDSTIQTKIPFLGDLWLVGTLFQKSDVIKDRREIIVVLMPHVVPYTPEYENQHQVSVAQATTPLFECGLDRMPRPWEPILPDAIRNPRVVRFPSLLPVGQTPACDSPLEFDAEQVR